MNEKEMEEKSVKGKKLNFPSYNSLFNLCNMECTHLKLLRSIKCFDIKEISNL